MMNLSSPTSKSGWSGSSSEKCRELQTTRLTGDVVAASSEMPVGKKLRSSQGALGVSTVSRTQMGTGTARFTTARGKKSANNTKFTNLSQRNRLVDFDNIINTFMDFSTKRSALLKDINDMENDILSISERIEEIRSNREELDSKQQTDAFSRARDKRKRVRSDIAKIKHDVRMVEAEITKLEMQLKWLVDYGS